MTKEEFEELEMEEIAEAVRGGSFSGITTAGSTWYIEINFEYEAMEDEDDGV